MISLYRTLFNNYSFTEEQSITIYVSMFALSIFFALIYETIKSHVSSQKGIVYNAFRFMCYCVISYPVVSVIGFRNQFVGFDTYNYVNGYLNSRYRGGVVFSFNTEPGFALFRRICYWLFGDKWYGLIFPMTFLTVMLMIYALDLWKKKHALPFGLFIFYMTMGLNLGDQARQLLALSMIAVSFYYLYHGNMKRYAIYVVLAATFHLSGILMLLLIPLSKVKMRRKINRYIFIGTAVGIGLMFFLSPNTLGMFLPQRYRYVLLMYREGGWGSKWIADVCPFVSMMVLSNYFYGKSSKVSKGFDENIALDNLVWYALIFRIAGYASFFIMRLYYYPVVLSIFTSSCKLSLIEEGIRRKALYLLCMIIFMLYFYLEVTQFGARGMLPYATDL